jgi:hypothetical protein
MKTTIVLLVSGAVLVGLGAWGTADAASKNPLSSTSAFVAWAAATLGVPIFLTGTVKAIYQLPAPWKKSRHD